MKATTKSKLMVFTYNKNDTVYTSETPYQRVMIEGKTITFSPYKCRIPRKAKKRLKLHFYKRFVLRKKFLD